MSQRNLFKVPASRHLALSRGSLDSEEDSVSDAAKKVLGSEIGVFGFDDDGAKQDAFVQEQQKQNELDRNIRQLKEDVPELSNVDSAKPWLRRLAGSLEKLGTLNPRRLVSLLMTSEGVESNAAPVPAASKSSAAVVSVLLAKAEQKVNAPPAEYGDLLAAEDETKAEDWVHVGSPQVPASKLSTSRHSLAGSVVATIAPPWNPAGSASDFSPLPSPKASAS